MGGHINVRSEEELRSILRGDVEALRECICRDGFDTDGVLILVLLELSL